MHVHAPWCSLPFYTGSELYIVNEGRHTDHITLCNLLSTNHFQLSRPSCKPSVHLGPHQGTSPPLHSSISSCPSASKPDASFCTCCCLHQGPFPSPLLANNAFQASRVRKEQESSHLCKCLGPKCY